MKKLIAILTIAIVLVGAVFADSINGDSSNGTATIRVIANISEQHPTFQLQALQAVYTRDNFNTTTFSSGNTSNVADSPTEGSVTLTTDALLENNKTATVSFAIVQIDRATSTAKYNLSVAATNLARTKTPADTTTGVDGTAADQFFQCATTAPVINKGSINGITYTGDATTTLNVNYGGNTVAAASTIATFDVVWNGKATALAGKYEATVTLTVTATT